MNSLWENILLSSVWPASKIDKDYGKGRSKMKIKKNGKMGEKGYRKRREEK